MGRTYEIERTKTKRFSKLRKLSKFPLQQNPTLSLYGTKSSGTGCLLISQDSLAAGLEGGEVQLS